MLDSNPLMAEIFDFGLQITGAVPTTAAVEGLLGPLSTINISNDAAPLPRFAITSSFNPVCPDFPCLIVPATLSLTSNGTAVATANVSVQSDADPVPFTVSSSAVPWLTTPIAAGVTPGQFTVAANPAGLAAGTYTTTIFVNNRPIAVTFNVLANGPTALLLPVERLQFAFQAGTTPPTQSVLIDGTPGLAWQATANVPWLQLIATGNAPVSRTINVLGATLPAGEYDGIITFTASGASPVYLLVHASVSANSSGYNINGVITRPNGTPAIGAIITLSSSSSITTNVGNDGTFQFFGIPGGRPYTLTPSLSGATFTPPSRIFTNISSSLVANFIASYPPTLTSATPLTPFGSPQTFQIRGSDPDGAADLNRIYFSINDAPSAAINTCHGFYDRAANAYFLYNDALSTLTGPLAPGAATNLDNIQCQLLGPTSTAAVITGNDITFSLALSRKAPFANTPHNLFIWVQDNEGFGTGWLQSAVWRPLGANPPVLASATLTNTTVQFRASDPDNNLARAYFLINTTPSVQTNGCHGFYDYAQNAFFLYDDTLTAFVNENTRCAIDRAQSNISNTGEVTLALVRKGAMPAAKIFLWIVDAQGLGTGWLDSSLNLIAQTNQPPTISNATPASATGLTQQFSAQISDPNQRFDLSRVYFLINPNSTIPQNSCHGFYDRPTNTLFLYNDALTAVSSTTLENSQCRIQNVTAVPNSNSALTLTFTATRKGAYTNATPNVYLWAVDFANNGTGWIQTSTWSNNANTPPTVFAPTPPALTGTPQTLAMSARDIDGASDITRLYFLINPTPNIPQNTCHGFYDKPTNALFLYNDALTAVLGPLTPGTAQIIQNTQCAINGAATNLATTGTDLTLNLTLNIKTTGATNAYLWPIDTQNTGSGWVRTASWSLAGPNQPPIVDNRAGLYVGSTPSPLILVSRDPDGYTDIQRVYFLVNPDTNIPQNTCHGFYDRAANALFLYNDATSALVATLQNSQYAIDGASLQVSTSPDARDLVLSFNVTYKSPFVNTPKNIYAWARDRQNADTGWVKTANLQPFIPAVGPASPASISSTNSVTLGIPIYSIDWQTNLSRAYFLIANSPNVSINGCHGFIDRATNGLFLYNDTLSAVLGPGSSQNSQCGVNANGAGFVQTSSFRADVNIPFTVSPGFIGTGKNVYIWAVDPQGAGSGWVQVATWLASSAVANLPPSYGTIFPSAAAGSPQSFAVKATDPNGYTDITRIYFLVSAANTPTANSCHGFYDRPTNLLYLYNDALTTLLGPLTPDEARSIQNSQCELSGVASSLTAIGSLDITINLGLSLKAPFAATAQKFYLLTQDTKNADTGWVLAGTWVSDSVSPPNAPILSPSSSTGPVQTLVLFVSDPDGNSNIRRIHFAIADSATSAPNSCRGYIDRVGQRLTLYGDNGTSLLGPYVLDSTAQPPVNVTGRDLLRQ